MEGAAIDLTGIDAAFHAPVDALARQMAAHGTRREEPVRATFGLLGDRWSTLILLVLGMGTWRHAELRRVLSRLGAEEGISQRVLTLKLRTLEREGFVARHVVESVPPKVSYALTPLGAQLKAQAERLIDWVNANRDVILDARARFDAQDAD
ncbi:MULTISPECIES: winged helix-turn-helix transcriptional regulator [Novosphingobium]|uniref:winged helix-turn-helix transcriptional regulator n=1 Tax=Novosphingobium TaxID=165696 RepID=UPI001CD4C671|nr:helix-turn-helix domain-containing protein [Novosphingobium percolationis]